VDHLAQRLPVSRPAVSQHLEVLKDAGLVVDRPDGNGRIYPLDPEGCDDFPTSTGSGSAPRPPQSQRRAEQEKPDE